MKRLPNILGFGVALLLMAATALVYIGPHFGLRIDNVVSGSMAPELQRGTMVIALRVDPQTIRTGDVIVFRTIPESDRPMVHRVVEIQQGFPLEFVTKGDALGQPDKFPVPAWNVLGKVAYHVGLLGFPAQFLRTTPGLVLSLLVPGIAIFLLCLQDIRKELRKKTK